MNRVFDSREPQWIVKRKKMQEICRRFERAPSNGHLKQLKSCLSACGDEVFIEAGFHGDYGCFIELGDRVYINRGCTFLDAGVIRIGDDCMFGGQSACNGHIKIANKTKVGAQSGISKTIRKEDTIQLGSPSMEIAMLRWTKIKGHLFCRSG